MNTLVVTTIVACVVVGLGIWLTLYEASAPAPREWLPTHCLDCGQLLLTREERTAAQCAGCAVNIDTRYAREHTRLADAAARRVVRGEQLAGHIVRCTPPPIGRFTIP